MFGTSAGKKKKRGVWWPCLVPWRCGRGWKRFGVRVGVESESRSESESESELESMSESKRGVVAVLAVLQLHSSGSADPIT